MPGRGSPTFSSTPCQLRNILTPGAMYVLATLRNLPNVAGKAAYVHELPEPSGPGPAGSEPRAGRECCDSI